MIGKKGKRQVKKEKGWKRKKMVGKEGKWLVKKENDW